MVDGEVHRRLYHYATPGGNATDAMNVDVGGVHAGCGSHLCLEPLAKCGIEVEVVQGRDEEGAEGGVGGHKRG